MLKRMLLTIAAAAMAIPFLQAQPTQAATTTTDIVVHKRLHNNARLNAGDWAYENNGTLKTESELVNTKGLNGAEFALFDATSLYQDALKAGQSAAALVATWRNKPRSTALAEAQASLPHLTTKATQTATMADGQTEDGIARFTVSQKQGSHYAAYLLIETKVDRDETLDVDLSKMAAPMLVVLPVHNAAGQALSTVHLYAKNVAYARDPYFFKFGRTTSGQDVRIKGAVFALYQLINGEKRYLSLDVSNAPRNAWITSSDPLNDAQVDKFISDADGLVNTGSRFLAGGTYYFEELKPAAGYVNNLGATGVKVEVPDTWTNADGSANPVLVNGEALVETNAGVVSAAQIKVGRPRVYNQRATTPTPSTPTTPTTVAKPSTPDATTTKLPQTGNVISLLLIGLGSLLILVAWLLRRRAHTPQ